MRRRCWKSLRLIPAAVCFESLPSAIICGAGWGWRACSFDYRNCSAACRHGGLTPALVWAEARFGPAYRAMGTAAGLCFRGLLLARVPGHVAQE